MRFRLPESPKKRMKGQPEVSRERSPEIVREHAQEGLPSLGLQQLCWRAWERWQARQPSLTSPSTALTRFALGLFKLSVMYN